MLLTAGHEQLELDENYKWFLRVVGKPSANATTLLKEVAFVLEQTNSMPDILTRQDYLNLGPDPYAHRSRVLDVQESFAFF